MRASWNRFFKPLGIDLIRKIFRNSYKKDYKGRRLSQMNEKERIMRSIESFLSRRYELRYNTVKQMTEFRPNDLRFRPWRPLTDIWAKKLAPFAGINETGVGMHEPYKLQLVIDICGLPRVLFAAVVSAITRPFGVHGLFYKICGKGVAGIDGFYFRSSFDRYKELALINPPNPVELCNQLEKDTGIPVVLMDANDIDQNQLGKCDDFPLTDEEIQDAMADNPSGQGDELTPLILIRPLS